MAKKTTDTQNPAPAPRDASEPAPLPDPPTAVASTDAVQASFKMAPGETVKPTPRFEPKRPFDVEVAKVADRTRGEARALYEAYIANSRGLAWDGRPCPAWDELGEPVQSHWCAVALAADAKRKQMVDDAIAATKAAIPSAAPALVVENERMKKELAQLREATGALDDRKVTAAVKDRTKLLESEVDGLRQQVAKLEAERRSGYKPWAGRKKPAGA